MAELYVDGVATDAYLREIITRYRKGALNSDDMFWSTSELRITAGGSGENPETGWGQPREVLQFEFSGPRIVNYIAFRTARFPHLVQGEYWHPTRNEWVPLREQIGKISDIDPAYDVAEQRAKWEGPPVSGLVVDSSPAVITSAKDTSRLGVTHPQHFGTNHWVQMKWKVVPVQTKAIRLILTRFPGGFHPVTPTGEAAPYSLAVKDFQAGFRVYSKEDIPASGRVTHEDFASSADLLGGRLSYRLKENSPEHVLNGIEGLFWKSEPQPVNYAVVNFYVDVRDPQGHAQTIDRFYIDPLTVGPTMNLYYTNDDPNSDFAADDSLLAYPIVQPKGTALTQELDPLRNTTEYIGFDDSSPAFLDIDNAYLQWDPERPWWLGVAVRLKTMSGQHPWFSFGGNTLRQNGTDIEFVTDDGTSYKVPMPEGLGVGSRVRVALAYTPYYAPEEASWLPGTITMTVGTPNLPYTTETATILPTSLGERPEWVSVGRYPEEGTPGTAAMDLAALVLKVDEYPGPGVLEGFVTDPDAFTLKPDYGSLADLTTNALLRVHPRFVTPDAPGGVVGGPGDRYEDAVWTPIARDYTLRQGFVRFPPTRAKHFKLEFTNLVHETYESLIPIRREVKLFPSEVVQAYERDYARRLKEINAYTPKDVYGTDPVSGLHEYASVAPGVRTMMEITDLGRYEAAVEVLNREAQRLIEGKASNTEAYVATDPRAQQDLSDAGWVWAYTPWHLGSSAPRFTLRQVHHYERVTVDHASKTAFFVGIRRLDAYRVNYASDDDTEIYYEQFLDDLNLSSLDNVLLTEEGIKSIGSYGVVTSNVFPSTRMVRGVQFASVQSDPIPLLADDGFISPDVTQHWEVYGDATLERLPGQGVLVNRGWHRRTYATIEATYPTYGDLEDIRYSDIEGTTFEGVAGGGIQSKWVTPSQAGRIYGAARVYAQGPLAGPIRLEIVSVDTGRVLASAEHVFSPGEEAVLKVGYSVGSAVDPETYAELEGIDYGDLDGTPYREFETEAIGGDVYVRLYQENPSQDAFLVERLSLLDAPVVWQFSVDGGETWYDALDIRNNPEGVLTFPEPGNALCWRALIFHPDAEVSALAIRPWYGGLLGSVTRSATDFTGPNRSVIDDYPDVDHDPLWNQGHDPLPSWWYTRDVASPVGGAPSAL